ncbi:hypothetical protein [Actinomadura sp. DC4]|uniref:hypothetical protein n=1 Tax=Actinomadura sp. DC4 TaxID=3055069 RepID=UPI0025B24B77|nr:hypothetical protein [Actinomadura sp. DC4]MDN3359702.1 hypothetical protein [Actinomadura sp. DC4]
MADDNEEVTSFDKTHYEQLIHYLMSVDGGINKTPSALGPSADLKLDSTLQTLLKPGSQNWDPVKNLVAQAGAFGDSAHSRYTAVEQEIRVFVNALKDAENVFEDTDDLASYDATKFGDEHPDVAGAVT